MNKKGYDGPGEVYDYYDIARAFQKTIEDIDRVRIQGRSDGGLAIVQKRYADRNTCDIRTLNGQLMHNVAMRAKGGIIDGELYGELDLPEEGDLVIVSMIGGQAHMPVIDGTVFAFLANIFQTGSPVNSQGKQFTKKLLESGKERYYRKIFKSGLTIEVQDDATVIVEKPDGTFFHLKNDGTFKIKDKNDNTIYSTNQSIIVNENLEVEL